MPRKTVAWNPNMRGRLCFLHAMGLTDLVIAYKMKLQPIVVTAQRRRLGLAANDKPDLTPSGADLGDMRWLALQLMICRDVSSLVGHLKKTLLLDGSHAPEEDETGV